MLVRRSIQRLTTAASRSHIPSQNFQNRFQGRTRKFTKAPRRSFAIQAPCKKPTTRSHGFNRLGGGIASPGATITPAKSRLIVHPVEARRLKSCRVDWIERYSFHSNKEFLILKSWSLRYFWHQRFVVLGRGLPPSWSSIVHGQGGCEGQGPSDAT